MKTISNIIAALILIAASAAAQDNPPVGFLRIVNAISPGEGKATFLIDSKNLYPDGYALGQTTGGYGVKSGSKTVEIRKEGLESGNIRINLEAGETMTLIAFAERIPAADPTAPPKWKIKLLRLKQQEVERGYGLSMVSLCKEEQTAVELGVMGKGKVEKAVAKRLGITKVDLGAMRGEIMVKVGENILTTVSPDSPGNYVVVLYQNAEGKTEALYYYDPKFVVAG